MFSTRPDTHRPHALRLAGLRASALYSLALAYGGGLALHLLHEASGAREPHAPPGVWHWLRDASLALPVIAVAVYLGASLASRLIERFGQNLSRASATGLRAVSVAVYASVAMAVGSPLHGLLFQAGHGEHELSLAGHLVRDGLWALVANLAIAFGVAAAPTGWRWTAWQWARGGSLAWRGATAPVLVLAGFGGMPPAVVPRAAAAGSGMGGGATRII